MTTCPSCNGIGTKPRERRMIGEDGAKVVDPLDVVGRFPELCAACQGTEVVPEKQVRAAAISAAKRAADIGG